jgi:hypothetical protein
MLSFVRGCVSIRTVKGLGFEGPVVTGLEVDDPPEEDDGACGVVANGEEERPVDDDGASLGRETASS